VLLLAAALVLGAAVVALPVLDRAARSSATALVTDQLQRELGLAEPPRVVIGGRWFLWQALRGRYQVVSINAATITYEGVTVERTLARLHEVRVPHRVLLGRGGTVRVGTGTARALVPWAELQARASAASGRDLVLSADGLDVRSTTTVSVLGRHLDLALTATPQVADGVLRLRPTRASVGGREVQVDDVRSLLARAGRQALLDGVDIPLGGVPPGVAVRSTTVVPEGVLVQADLTAMAVPVAAG